MPGDDDDERNDEADGGAEAEGDDAEPATDRSTIMEIPADELHQRVDLAEMLIGKLQELFLRRADEARALDEDPDSPGAGPDPADDPELSGEVRDVGGMMIIEPRIDPRFASALEKAVEGLQQLLPGLINLAMDHARRDEVEGWRRQMTEAREVLDEWDEAGGPPDEEDAPTPEQVAEMRREVEHAEALLRGYDLLTAHFKLIEEQRNQILARMVARTRRALSDDGGN